MIQMVAGVLGSQNAEWQIACQDLSASWPSSARWNSASRFLERFQGRNGSGFIGTPWLSARAAKYSFSHVRRLIFQIARLEKIDCSVTAICPDHSRSHALAMLPQPSTADCAWSPRKSQAVEMIPMLDANGLDVSGPVDLAVFLSVHLHFLVLIGKLTVFGLQLTHIARQRAKWLTQRTGFPPCRRRFTQSPLPEAT